MFHKCCILIILSLIVCVLGATNIDNSNNSEIEEKLADLEANIVQKLNELESNTLNRMITYIDHQLDASNKKGEENFEKKITEAIDASNKKGEENFLNITQTFIKKIEENFLNTTQTFNSLNKKTEDNLEEKIALTLNALDSMKKEVQEIQKSQLISKADAEMTQWFYDPLPYRYEFNEKAAGWLNLHVVPATWQDARLLCHAEGAVLASPLTNKVKEAIVEFVSNKRIISKTIFIGIHATFSKGVYNSIEGVPLSRLPVTWAANEPNNLDNTESCLVMQADNEGAVAYTNCSNKFPFVCYKTFPNECGTADSEYRLFAPTGSCYKVHWPGSAWSKAFKTCAGEGAHLAILNSEEEAKYLGSMVRENYAHVGFHDWGSYGRRWMTINGKTLAKAGYAKWISGEPNNSTGGEFCGSINGKGELNDMYCTYTRQFFCELTPGLFA